MKRAWALLSCAGTIAIALVAACATSPRETGSASVAPATATVKPPTAPDRDPSHAPPPTIPEAPAGAFAPSLARVVGDPHGLGSTLADVDTCGGCHTDVAAQWRKSAHAFASFNNPVYRTVVDKLRKDRGQKTSHFCAGCHDISLMVDGMMETDIQPMDLRAHAGVTCATCHSIAEARADGNGSWDLDASPIPMPKEGDPESNLRHRARVGRPTLRTEAMCATCHKAFLDKDTGNASHLTGQDDATPWARSAFAGSLGAFVDEEVPQKDCRGCHMPRVPAENNDPGAKNGTIASHWFLGGHTWLSSMENDPELQARVQAFMKDRVSLDVGGVRHEGGKHELVSASPVAIVPGERAVIDVVVRNLDVGHRFPGGVMDAQDTWIEIVVDDAKGKRVAEAGTDQETTGVDPTAHSFASYMAQEDGSRLLVRETHLFRAPVYNQTIPPRDASVVGYAFYAPPEEDRYPLKVSVRLRHRSRRLELQKAACADTRSERGKAFGKAGLNKVARAIDACRPQPVTDLGRVEIALSTAAHPSPARADETQPIAFARRFAYALGLSHALQERLDDARLPLAAAGELAKTPREHAIVFGGYAYVSSHQGRTDETFQWAGRADAAAKDAGMEPPPAMQHARANVLTAQWRLAEAAPLFLDVANRSPRDDGAWSLATVTLGGAGDPIAALDAARHGLALQPRDGDMLRVQALSLADLHKEDPRAQDAFLDRRTPDDAPAIRGRCSAKVPGCANERVPVHVHDMRLR